MALFITEARNLFPGSDTPERSKHKNLISMKLPTLEEKSQDHYGAGAIGEIAIGGLGLNKLEMTFKMAGIDPQVQSLIGVYDTPFTAYGGVRDKENGRAIEVKALIWGRLGKIEEDEFKRGDLQGHDHMVHEIMRYYLYWDGKIKYKYDWRSDDWEVDGVSRNDMRSILRIPGA